MQIIKTVAEMKEFVKKARRQGQTVGLVPTMGYLHEGHLTLMKQAKKECQVVVASIFVNPLQFGVGEDFETYPRDLTRDAELAESVGVDAIFAPTAGEMYPKGYQTTVEVGELANHLCGLSRPGHFKGVTTVVNKLFNIVQPDKAFFGQKDAQQVLVLKRMAADLNMNLELVTVPIVRESDGLAMSSRNVYLSPEERQAALVLNRSLQAARQWVHEGEKSGTRLRQRVVEFIEQEPLARIDYVEVKSEETLETAEVLEGSVLIALAVRFGNTRLIDNTVITL
ncbi:MAG TPA: pantoate--beta-alanine ligase [Bacillota bacterium]|nr:pantoate--beta-alanine ligase [Bacillota bacterium]